jgi:hypothetical protein
MLTCGTGFLQPGFEIHQERFYDIEKRRLRIDGALEFPILQLWPNPNESAAGPKPAGGPTASECHRSRSTLRQRRASSSFFNHLQKLFGQFGGLPYSDGKAPRKKLIVLQIFVHTSGPNDHAIDLGK